jgi:rare lipoprotein A
MKLLMICSVLVLLSLPPGYGASKAPDSNHTKLHRVQYGMASWYGARDQGRLMACGKPFNDHLLIAAHRTLPFGTRVRVTNLRNGRSVVVRIVDRGPGVAGRVIDLSKAAARRLRFTRRGLTPVRIRVLSMPKKEVREPVESAAMNHSAEHGPS